MKKLPCDILIAQIDELQKSYRETFVLLQDIKALQGVERCIELKMKIWGFDGKNNMAHDMGEVSSEIVLDLSKLSTQTLREILDPSSPLKY